MQSENSYHIVGALNFCPTAFPTKQTHYIFIYIYSTYTDMSIFLSVWIRVWSELLINLFWASKGKYLFLKLECFFFVLFCCWFFLDVTNFYFCTKKMNNVLMKSENSKCAYCTLVRRSFPHSRNTLFIELVLNVFTLWAFLPLVKWDFKKTPQKK